MAKRTKEQRRKQRKAKEQRKRENRRQELAQSGIMSEALFEMFHAYWFLFEREDMKFAVLEAISQNTGLSHERAHLFLAALFVGLLSHVDSDLLTDRARVTAFKLLGPDWMPEDDVVDEELEEAEFDDFAAKAELVNHIGDVSRLIPLADLLAAGLSNIDGPDSAERRPLTAAVSRFFSSDFSEFEVMDVEESAELFGYDPDSILDLWASQLLMRETVEPDDEERARRTAAIGRFLEIMLLPYLGAEKVPDPESPEYMRARVLSEIAKQILTIAEQHFDTRGDEDPDRYDDLLDALDCDAQDEAALDKVRAAIAPEAKALGGLSQTDFYGLCSVASRNIFAFHSGTARRVEAASTAFLHDVMDAVDPTLMRQLQDEQDDFIGRMFEGESDENSDEDPEDFDLREPRSRNF